MFIYEIHNVGSWEAWKFDSTTRGKSKKKDPLKGKFALVVLSISDSVIIKCMILNNIQLIQLSDIDLGIRRP